MIYIISLMCRNESEKEKAALEKFTVLDQADMED